MKSQKKNTAAGFTLIEVILTIVLVALVGAMLVTYFNRSITHSSVPIFRLNAASRLHDVLEKISADYASHPQWRQDTAYAADAQVLPSPGKRTGLLYEVDSPGTSGSSEPDWSSGGSGTVSDNTVSWTPHEAAPILTSFSKSWSASSDFYKGDVIEVSGERYLTPADGESGGTEPSWLFNLGDRVNDNTIRWIYIGPPALVLQTAIGTEGVDYDNDYGRYRVIHNRFIRFDTTASPATEVDLTGNTSDEDYGKFLKVTIGMHSGDADATGETLTTLFVIR